MNLPNKITVFRFCMIPLFLVVFLWQFPYADYVALAIFLIASVSDFLDGYLARKLKLITDFGKLMDPLADKLLVTSALVCFVYLRADSFPCWCAIVVLVREFVISGFRQLAAEKKVIIQASWWGKAKTVTQMITCCMYILVLPFEWYRILAMLMLGVSTALTVISLVDYIIKNRDVIKNASK